MTPGPALQPPATVPAARMGAWVTMLAVWGPGLLVMLADTDAGNIITAAQAGTQWGYRLLPLPLLLIPMLIMVQELAVRLGLFSGSGFGELLRDRFGLFWAWLAGAALIIATLASLVTEFDGVAGVGALFGVPRAIALVLSAACLLAVVLTGKYRQVERVALCIGLFELGFFIVAYAAHPHIAAIARDIAQQPLGNHAYLYVAAALIGATFNPWMIFYQPSALVEKGLGPTHHSASRIDTILGAILTQSVTASVLIAAAATLGIATLHGQGLDSVGQISQALTPFLGHWIGTIVFSMGVLGASIVAAIVCSLALAWGLGEIAGLRHALERRPGQSLWFCAIYVAGVFCAAMVVWLSPDLVWLSIASQAVNAVLMPLMVSLLIALAATALPEPVRLRGWYLRLVAALCAVVAVAGLAGAWAGLS